MRSVAFTSTRGRSLTSLHRTHRGSGFAAATGSLCCAPCSILSVIRIRGAGWRRLARTSRTRALTIRGCRRHLRRRERVCERAGVRESERVPSRPHRQAACSGARESVGPRAAAAAVGVRPATRAAVFRRRRLDRERRGGAACPRDRVRASIDIDVYRATAFEIAERELREAADRDIGDWFRFEIGPGRPAGDGSPSVRLPVIAFIGATEWARYHVDLVGSEIVMTGTPEPVPPLARVAIPDVEQHGYRAYPLVDHIADKVAAMFQRYGRDEQPSTRFRDLVDLVSMIKGAAMDASAQTIALRSEEARRRITLPQRFDVPDRAAWEPGYAAEARNSLLPYATTLDEALALVRPFIDPLLDGTAVGSWDPEQSRWRANP